MNKVALLSLNDFLIDPSEGNLKIFCLTINPMFVLTSKNKKVLLDLIEKYRKDNQRLRLKAIEMYLAATKEEKKIIKKAVPLVIEEHPKDPDFATKKDRLIELQRRDRLIELQRTLMRGLKNHSAEAEKTQEDLYNQIKQLKLEMGLSKGGSEAAYMNMGTEGALESKQILFKSVFGDWETPGTNGYSLTHPNGVAQFAVTNHFAGLWWDSERGKSIVDTMVKDITGLPNQGYKVVEDTSQTPSVWIFTKTHVRITKYIKNDQNQNIDMAWLERLQPTDQVAR